MHGITAIRELETHSKQAILMSIYIIKECCIGGNSRLHRLAPVKNLAVILIGASSHPARLR